MTNQLELAQTAVNLLNELYKENIFSIDYGSNEKYASIINDKYRYEGNDVNINFYEGNIVGNITGSTVSFSSIDNLVKEIDQLFINE